jgi:hypothetical protein
MSLNIWCIIRKSLNEISKIILTFFVKVLVNNCLKNRINNYLIMF